MRLQAPSRGRRCGRRIPQTCPHLHRFTSFLAGQELVNGLVVRTHSQPKVGLDGNVSHRIHLDMMQIQQTDAYAKWFAGLRDRVARARIDIRIRRLSLGNAGDVKPIGEGVSELRVNHGPGYRVYFIQRGEVVIILLAGGDKSTQDKDIRNAKSLANDLKE